MLSLREQGNEHQYSQYYQQSLRVLVIFYVMTLC